MKPPKPSKSTCNLLIVGAATGILLTGGPAHACRIVSPRPPPTQAMIDEGQIRTADVAALGIVTLHDPLSDGVLVEVRTTDVLRGPSPLVLTVGPEIIILTCSDTPPVSQLVDRLDAGDQVLVLAKWMGQNLMPFNIMKVDDPQAVRLLALLRTERSAPR